MMKILMEGPKFLHGDNQIKNKTYKKMFISAKDLEKRRKLIGGQIVFLYQSPSPSQVC